MSLHFYFAVPMDAGPLYIGFCAVHQGTFTFSWSHSVLSLLSNKIFCKRLVLLTRGAPWHRQCSPSPKLSQTPKPASSQFCMGSSYAWKEAAQGPLSWDPFEIPPLIQKHTSTSLLLTCTDVASSFWALLSVVPHAGLSTRVSGQTT